MLSLLVKVMDEFYVSSKTLLLSYVKPLKLSLQKSLKMLFILNALKNLFGCIIF